MKTGLAIWHYPHRSVIENVRFFAEHGFDSVSIHEHHMVKHCENEALAEEVAKKGLVLTA